MSVLFVCLGNICRSPSAEALFRVACPNAPSDSAGTGNWHVGEPPYPDMQEAANRRGIDMSDLRARQFRTEDFEAFDLLIAMDPANQRDMERLRPPGNDTPIRLLAPYADAGEDTVPDPYYTRDFDGALDMLEVAIAALVAEVSGL